MLLSHRKNSPTSLFKEIRAFKEKGGRPDLFRFVPISPFSSDLFRFALLVFGNAPISSDLFRFLPICSDLILEQIRTNQGNPFLPTPFANPRVRRVLAEILAEILADVKPAFADFSRVSFEPTGATIGNGIASKLVQKGQSPPDRGQSRKKNRFIVSEDFSVYL